MTEGEDHQLTFSNFLTLFRLPYDGFSRTLHDEGPLEAKRMTFMCPRNARDSWGHVKGLYTYYSILNRLFRKTLTPRDGNTSDITAFQRNLMVAMKPGEPTFNVGDFLWQEIKNSSENPQRLCSYGPYISYIIKKVTQRAYPNDTKHRPLKPKPNKTVRVPPHRMIRKRSKKYLKKGRRRAVGRHTSLGAVQRPSGVPLAGREEA
jgi:hypothetical protein